LTFVTNAAKFYHVAPRLTRRTEVADAL
jgi:hypothetical protein